VLAGIRQGGSATVKRVAAAVAGLVTVFVVAGCGAGQDTQTDSIQPAVNGALGQIGPIMIRDAQFAPGERGVIASGSDAELRLTIINTGNADDELTEVSSPVVDEETDVEITGDRSLVGRRAIQVGGGGGAVVQSSPTTPTSTSGPGSSTTRPTTSVAGPKAVAEIGKARIVLKRLNTALNPGKTYPVTFVFRNAGSVTINLPIANPTGPRPTGESNR
jgi:copper(I)-binding protein